MCAKARAQPSLLYLKSLLLHKMSEKLSNKQTKKHSRKKRKKERGKIVPGKMLCYCGGILLCSAARKSWLKKMEGMCLSSSKHSGMSILQLPSACFRPFFSTLPNLTFRCIFCPPRFCRLTGNIPEDFPPGVCRSVGDFK